MMNDTTPDSERRCSLCKKTFKQKSSLVRHAKRCTLEPMPSARQKACRSCICAKARCDLQRPACSRCDGRSIPCVYARPVRIAGRQEPTATTATTTTTTTTTTATTNSGSDGSVRDANSELVCGLPPVAPQPCLGSIGTGTGPVTIAETDRDVAAYLGCASDFTGLSGSSASAIHNRLIPDLFPSSLANTSDATPGSGTCFDTVYSTSSTAASIHAAHNAHSHHCPNSHAGSLDTQLDVDSSSPTANTDLSVILQADLGGVGSVADSWPTTGETTDIEEIEPWILALAAKSIRPDPPGLVEHSVQTLFRAFRSWPRMLAKGIQLPPIIHLSQFYCGSGKEDSGDVCGLPRHIARCITLCKMWVGQAEGSGQIVQAAVKGEIQSILSKYRTYDAPTLLAAMQSLAILLILLLFPSNRQGILSLVQEETFCAVQEMANHVLSTGMMLHEEASHVRPPWRVWAHIEAKRRTLMCIYFLHWAYSAYHGTRHFNCLQLGRMLAPGAKWLWQAADEKIWMGLYARWLAQWDGKEFIQAEFFLVDKGPVMDPRVEMWLEDADELGMLIMSIVNASQRDLAGITDAEGNIVG
ncbi:hypothetical protein GGR51DRAFT_541572 [Nemania sp. FL0031]|nr:hypothetical protein GGR51DRAFT_541572 [Nemania sp. FL0031]